MMYFKVRLKPKHLFILTAEDEETAKRVMEAAFPGSPYDMEEAREYLFK